MKHKILIADFDTHFARRLADYFWDHGFEARAVHTVAEARSAITSWQPQTLFLNLMLPETNAISLIRFIKTQQVRVKPIITVMSKQSMPVSIDEVRQAGVRFTLLKPFPLEEALRIAEINSRTEPVNIKAPPEAASVRELHLMNLILKQAMGRDSARMFNLLRMINLKVDALRCSVIQWITPLNGVVLASNDDENISGHKLNLREYPEIETVRVTGRSLIIPNVRTSDILAPVQSKLKETPYETMVLFPIYHQGKFFGVLSLRMLQKHASDMNYIEKFGEVCSHIVSLALPPAA